MNDKIKNENVIMNNDNSLIFFINSLRDEIYKYAILWNHSKNICISKKNINTLLFKIEEIQFIFSNFENDKFNPSMKEKLKNDIKLFFQNFKTQNYIKKHLKIPPKNHHPNVVPKKEINKILNHIIINLNKI